MTSLSTASSPSSPDRPLHRDECTNTILSPKPGRGSTDTSISRAALLHAPLLSQPSQRLLSRSLGSLSPRAYALDETTALVHAFNLAPLVGFDSYDQSGDGRNGVENDQSGRRTGRERGGSSMGAVTSRRTEEKRDQTMQCYAHKAGVNSLVVERFEGRLWDSLLCEEKRRR